MRIGCQRLPWEFNYSNGTMVTAPVMKGPSPRGHRITWYLQYISRMVVEDGRILCCSSSLSLSLCSLRFYCCLAKSQAKEGAFHPFFVERIENVGGSCEFQSTRTLRGEDYNTLGFHWEFQILIVRFVGKFWCRRRYPVLQVSSRKGIRIRYI